VVNVTGATNTHQVVVTRNPW